jgi:hypothetical protein
MWTWGVKAFPQRRMGIGGGAAAARKEKWWKGEDFPRIGTRPLGWRAATGKQRWWARQDSNLQPDGYEPSALTIELQARRASVLAKNSAHATLDRDDFGLQQPKS